MATLPTTGNISALVESMFADVFTADERSVLLERIHDWERLNPDVDSAHRVTGWIDVAYAFQEQMSRTADLPAERRPTAAVAWTLRQA